MNLKKNPILKIYQYIPESGFVPIGIVDDYESISWQRSKYRAGDFTVEINKNISNAMIFKKNLFVLFGSDGFDFGVITSVQDTVGSDGKGSQKRTITGKDARYIFKRRIIIALNDEGMWSMTGEGESIMSSLIVDQCPDDTQRALPVSIPSRVSSIGETISVSESFTNLYEVLCSVAEGSKTGWRIHFDGEKMNLIFYSGNDLSGTIEFSTERDSLESGTVTDSTESFCNAVYIGGNGQGSERDIYEAERESKNGHLSIVKNKSRLITENGNLIALNLFSPTGLDRFEGWGDVGDLNSVEDYEAEAVKMLNTYGETLDLSGKGLAKSPYIYKRDYDVGDTIGMSVNGIKATVEIISVTEHWAWNSYQIDFEIGKPIITLGKQISTIVNQIQKGVKKETTESVKWYTIPTDTEMKKGETIYSVIGFKGDVGTGKTFKLYLDKGSGNGSKTYHVYLKQLAGSGKLTLTTGIPNATNLQLSSGTYTCIIFVDSDGNISRTI